MTDETRAELRRGIEAVVRAAAAAKKVHSLRLYAGTSVGVYAEEAPPETEHPPLTTAQQLALSVLLGDDIPLGVLLTACDDAGVFADGLAGEIERKARAEERERCAVLVESRADTWGVGDYELNEIAAAIRRT